MTRRVAVDAPPTERSEFGPARFFAVYLVLLFVVPARLVIPGTGAIGTPAAMLALVALGWWCSATLLGQREFTGRNAVRTALFVYLAFVFLSWTLGKTRVLTPLESTTSDRAILATLGLVGIALVAMDGLRSIDEVERVLKWVLTGATVMALFGLVQFFFRIDLTRVLELPGLQVNTATEGVSSRSGFNRPHGTALHAIEFGVVSAALTPMAYWYGRRRGTPVSNLPLVVLAFAAMVSLSRSAVLAAAVVIVMVLIGSTWRERAIVLSFVGVFVVIVGVLVDGLIGTLKSLFTSADTDPSVQARIDRIPRVWALIAEHPWLGRGYGRYTPEDYFLLDNEIQKTAIESGLIGVAVLVLFVGFVAQMAWRTRVGDESERFLGTALAATTLGLFISSYTFDAFFYRILTGVLYLSIGLTGAMYRLTAVERARADGIAVDRAVADARRRGVRESHPAMSP